MTEGQKVYYRDSYGDRHTARISYIFISVWGTTCAHLTDGATKLLTELTQA